MPKKNVKQVHYIYKIIFLCGEPQGRYYLGKHSGQLEDSYAGSGSFCKKYYKKYGKHKGKTYIKEIIEINPDKKTNARREVEIIGDLYKTDELCMNFIKGGDNPGDYSVDSKEKIRKALLGNKNGSGHITSKETKEKIIYEYGKQVIQYDLNGNIIATYKSIHEASKQINGCIMGISNACNRKIKTYLSFIWRFVGNELTNSEISNLTKRTEKKVIQLSIDGKYIREFRSVKEAHDITNISGATISLVACGKRKTAGGYK
jgi:hypothetical protein